MQSIKSFEEFLSENYNQRMDEKMNWEAIPVLGGWVKAMQAKVKAADLDGDDQLRSRNSHMMKLVKSFYDKAKLDIEKRFSKYPELVKDKLAYLDHFIWASAKSVGWDMDVILKLERGGNWDKEMKDLFNSNKNTHGFTFPEYIWYEDLFPEIDRIRYDIKFAEGYLKRFKKK